VHNKRPVSGTVATRKEPAQPFLEKETLQQDLLNTKIEGNFLKEENTKLKTKLQHF
jgi:hypothetical protein